MKPPGKDESVVCRACGRECQGHAVQISPKQVICESCFVKQYLARVLGQMK